MILVDTDVLIWCLRGNPKAAAALDRLDEFALSAVTYMELVQGMRNKQELLALRTFLREWDAAVIPISEPISSRATFYVEEHFHAHSLQLADALIAATSVVLGVPLLTGNVKHYRAIKGLSIKRFTP